MQREQAGTQLTAAMCGMIVACCWVGRGQLLDFLFGTLRSVNIGRILANGIPYGPLIIILHYSNY